MSENSCIRESFTRSGLTFNKNKYLIRKSQNNFCNPKLGSLATDFPTGFK